ncbi:MAG: DUF4917 family protein [Gemmatimonadales bacterium]
MHTGAEHLTFSKPKILKPLCVACRSAAKILEEYLPGQQDVITILRRDAAALKEVLVQTLGRRHPSRPSEVSAAEYGYARRFLSRFNDVYTLNYDLLLYWTVMQTEILPNLEFSDGFRTPEDGPAPYVTWEMENSYNQKMFYLHGALHIFDGGHEVQKYTWRNTQEALMDQIRAALEQELYPIYVSDGDSTAKRAQIRHSDYLVRGHKSLLGISGALYVYGHSMDPGDDHVIRLIEKNKCKQLCVGLYGDPFSPDNLRIRRRANQVVSRRPSSRPLSISYFDASTAHVWRG